MEKKRWEGEGRMFVGLFCGLVFGVVSGAAIYASAYPAFQSKEWAAWVQALGVIAALIGSLWISRAHTRTAFATISEAQSLTARTKMSAMLAIVEAAHERSERIAEVFRKELPRHNVYSVYASSVTESIIGALTAVPAHEVGSRMAVLALLDIRDQFVYLDRAVTIFIDGPRKHPHLSKIFDAYEPGDPKIMSVYAGHEEILARNVLVHTNVIAKQYEAFKAATKQHIDI